MSDPSLIAKVETEFRNSAENVLANSHLAQDILAVASGIHQCFNSGNKLLICGNGGSAADAQHLSSEFLNRYRRERRELPAVALTTDASTLTSIANDYHFDEVFSKQVRALANAGDLLMLITTSGNSENILQAVRAAHEKSVKCIALSGKAGGKLADLLATDDMQLLVASDVTARIQEVHGLIIHVICELVDNFMLGDDEDPGA